MAQLRPPGGKSGAPPGGLHTDGGGSPRPAQWALPEDVSTSTDDTILTPEQVARWKRDRYLVLDGLWPAELIAEAVATAAAEFPDPSETHPAATLGEGQSGFGGIGTNREFPFDSEHDVYNMLTLHPRVLRCCSQLLGTSGLRLTRSNYGAKYGANGHELPRTEFDGGWPTGDQNMHCDFGNNTMLVPSRERPDCVAGICYLNRVEDGGGATGIVPYDPSLPEGMPVETAGGWGRQHGWEGHQIYEKEKLVRYKPGTVLLYRMDTYHRGTIVYPEGVRRVWGAVWRRADADYVHAGGQGMHGVGNGAFGQFAHIFPRVSPYQRSVVGFPMPGVDYWNADTVERVGVRYPGVDMTPYAQARL